MNGIVALLIGVLLQSPLQFEVASVKQNRSGFGFADMDFPSSGRVNVVNATFKALMQASYRIQDYQIIGGPAWLNSDRFDIQAKPSTEYQPKPTAPCLGPDCPLTPVQMMMQALLADRFQLKTHREIRELPVYELTIAKNGFKLKEVPPSSSPRTPPPLPPAPPPGTPPPTNPAALLTPPDGAIMIIGSGLSASAVPLTALASALAGLLGRPVIDKTGLKGEYDFKFVYSRTGLPNAGLLPGASAPPVGLDANDPMPSIFTAVQEQLGLKLDSTKGPVEVVVIDSVSKPIEN